MQCAACRREAPPDAAFCPECGAPLTARCGQCGTENAPGHKFCKKCGQALVEAPAREREATRLKLARAAFARLDAPRYVERADRLARELGA